MLEAFGCWLRLSCGRGLPDGMEAHPLVAAATEGLRNEGTFHQAVDAVRWVLSVCCRLARWSSRGWSLPTVASAGDLVVGQVFSVC